jgi:hypothetical protein
MQKSSGNGCCNYGQAAVIEMISDSYGVRQQARLSGSNDLTNLVLGLKQALSAEQALRNGLESRVNELETENKALKEEIDHHKAVTDCVLPFVRDHHNPDIAGGGSIQPEVGWSIGERGHCPSPTACR